ncbi:MAG: type II toxin-antitoxin system Phd/YefM family antitoxin [Candidatus Firestonebacteria bacterium]
MITLKENTTLVGITELRLKIDDVLKSAKKGKVIIEKRNKPVAVLLTTEEYEKIEELLDLVEDKIFGEIARKRYEEHTEKDYISLEESKKRVGLK